jgi:hypothetical protein
LKSGWRKEGKLTNCYKITGESPINGNVFTVFMSAKGKSFSIRLKNSPPIEEEDENLLKFPTRKALSASKDEGNIQVKTSLPQ